MKFDVYLKLKEKPIYTKFIRENSEWYKILNRDPNMFDKMVEDMKDKYKLRVTDKIDNVVDSVDIISKFLKVTNEK